MNVKFAHEGPHASWPAASDCYEMRNIADAILGRTSTYPNGEVGTWPLAVAIAAYKSSKSERNMRTRILDDQSFLKRTQYRFILETFGNGEYEYKEESDSTTALFCPLNFISQRPL